MMPRKREFAYWIFARELRDSTVIQENQEEERSKPYIITPLGSRVRRVLFCGTVTQKNSEENMTKVTVTDGTGNFYITAFANDFGIQGKIMLDELEINDSVTVMGRVSTFKNEDKIYFSINPEIAVKADEISLRFWNLRARHSARRKIYAIRVASGEREMKKEDIMQKGYSPEEAECAIRSVQNYPDYNSQDFEVSITSGSGQAVQKPDGKNNRDFVLGYIKSNDSDGKGCRYEDIIAAARNSSISQGDVDDLLNDLGSDGEIFEVSLKRYKVI